jgi:hypothetical protein
MHKSGKLLNQASVFIKASIVSAALAVYGTYPLNPVLLDPDQMNCELHLLHSVIAFGEERSGVPDYVSTA